MRALKLYGSLFLYFGVSFGVAMGALSAVLFGFFGNGAVEGLVVGLVSGVPFGLLMAAATGTMQLVGTRGTPRGTSLRPRQRLVVPVVNDPGLPDRIIGALRGLPAQVTVADVTTGRFAATRSTSWKSWGEDVVVQLTDPSAPVATISSEPKLRTTLVDYGRGRKNVEHVARAIAR